MTFERPVYPFTAVVGQERLKLAIVLNAIDPAIGGVLFTGAKGTGKSLTVRSVTNVLPEVEAVEGCKFNCKPSDPTNMCESCRLNFEEGGTFPKKVRKTKIVQIPISVTEDRVIGTLDVEKTLREGVKGLQPGLLAEANQNILYIDEVNLLPDHVVDVILDSAASGWNIVEREGISVAHPSRFTLIGSMNPEEGELRPQILDRFALHVKADDLQDQKARVEIIKRNEEFAENPSAFLKIFQAQQKKLRRRIEIAKNLLNRVKIPESIYESVSKVCIDLHVDGYRPDIVTMRTARALAAFEGKEEVTPEDVLKASELALSHRTRKAGTGPPPSSKEIFEALKTTTIGASLTLKRSKKTKIIDFLRRLDLKVVLKKLRSGYPRGILTLIITVFLLINLSVIFSYQMLQHFFSQLPSQIISSPIIFIISSSIAALLTTLIIMEWLKRTGRKRLPTRLLDFSKIINWEHGISSKMIVEEPEKAPRNPMEIEYTGKTALEQGQKTLGEVHKHPEAPIIKPNLSRKERAVRGSGYLMGKRAKTVASTHRGRYVWYEFPRERPWDIALGPTIRVAAPYQSRRKQHKLSVVIKDQDIRVKMREYRAPFSIILLVDMSWSMINSMENLGRAIFSLHKSVYRRRDRVGLIVFKGSDAFIIQQPTTNLDLVVRKLFKVKASDFTPLAAGMLKAWRVLRLEKHRNRDAEPMLIIISDGITNVSLKRPISTYIRKSFMNRPQADVIDVARLMARDKIRTFIINTSHREEESVKWRAPTKFLMEVAKISGGSYYGLSLQRENDLIMQAEGAKLEDWFYFEEEAK